VKSTAAPFFRTKISFSGQEILEIIKIFSYFFQFVVFSPMFLFLKPTEPSSVGILLTGSTNSKKKQWKGHKELKKCYSNGPTKTEPIPYPFSWEWLKRTYGKRGPSP